jgi:glycosyltransferase involved in cell wall biosynthesis
MKILYLHQYFNNPSMSGGTRSFEMARRMVAAGHEVHIITSSRKSDSSISGWVCTLESGINVHWLVIPYSNNFNFLKRIKAFLNFAFAALSRALELKGDIVFATSTPLTVAIPAVFASRKLEIPMIFEVRDLWPEMPIAMKAIRSWPLIELAKGLERWAYRNSSVVIALSPGMKDGVVKTGYPADRVVVIPNGSDNSEFNDKSLTSNNFRAMRPWLGDRPFIVYAGTFGEVNGVDYAVSLASHLKRIESDICILLVGEGRKKEKVIDLAVEAGVYEDNLFIEPSMSKKNIPELLFAATMGCNFVIDLPEARANSANKFFDTLAAGRPVFVNHGGWMHAIVQKHKCGITAWNKPISEVALELNKFINDEEALSSSRRAARVLAEKYFDRDVLAKKLLIVFESVEKRESTLPAALLTVDYV